MSNIRIRRLTVGLVVLAVVLVLVSVAVGYFTKAAAQLPSFFPGHAAQSTKHHIRHGLAFGTLALFALGAAWFTTAPERGAE